MHYNDYAAKLQGAQIAYDVGIQRTCWGIHALTNWMGDDGRLKSLTGQYRSHVYLSDVVRLGGKVEAKEVDADGDHVVKLDHMGDQPARTAMHAGDGRDCAAASRCRRRFGQDLTRYFTESCSADLGQTKWMNHSPAFASST